MIQSVWKQGLWLLLIGLASGCGNFMKLSKNYAAEKAKALKIVYYEVPEMYELLLVAASQTSVFQKDSNLVNRSTSYYQEVKQQFSAHARHPLVQKIQKNYSKAGVYGYAHLADRFLFITHVMDNGRVKKHPDLRLPWFASMVPLKFIKPGKRSHRKMIESFYKETGFREFYQKHRPYYDSLCADANKYMEAERMWTWLEGHFKGRHEGYRVILSPLIGGFHNTTTFEWGDVSETVMLVGAPHVDPRAANYSEVLSKGSIGRMVFTEIDHNYVNPTTDGYKKELEKAMSDHKKFNTEKQGYKSAYMTFNEYMTWALYSCYVMDHYEPEVAERIISRQENFMEQRRGFIQYKAFNRYLMDWYTAHKGRKRLEECYPEAMAWFARQS